MKKRKDIITTVEFTQPKIRDAIFLDLSFWVKPSEISIKKLRFILNKIKASINVDYSIMIPGSSIVTVDHQREETWLSLHSRNKFSQIKVCWVLSSAPKLLEEETETRKPLAHNTHFSAYREMIRIENVFVHKIEESELNNLIER